MLVTDKDFNWNRLNIPQDYWLASDLFELVCGKFIGEGTSRIVFDYLLEPGYVIKIEKEQGAFNNIAEFEIWRELQYQKDLNKWLAPCFNISPNGRWLVQRKVIHINDSNKKNIPTKIPHWLSDMKFSNYGFIGKQFVSMDYPSSLNHMISNVGNRMKTFKSHLKEE